METWGCLCWVGTVTCDDTGFSREQGNFLENVFSFSSFLGCNYLCMLVSCFVALQTQMCYFLHRELKENGPKWPHFLKSQQPSKKSVWHWLSEGYHVERGRFRESHLGRSWQGVNSINHGIITAVKWKALLSRCQPRAQCFAKLLLSATLWGLGAGQLSNLPKISHETWPQKWEPLYTGLYKVKVTSSRFLPPSSSPLWFVFSETLHFHIGFSSGFYYDFI